MLYSYCDYTKQMELLENIISMDAWSLFDLSRGLMLTKYQSHLLPLVDNSKYCLLAMC